MSAFAALAARLRRLTGRVAPGRAPGAAASAAGPEAVSPSGERPSRAAQAGFVLALAAFFAAVSLVMLAAKFPEERLRLWLERTLSPGRGLTLAVREVRTTLFPPGAVAEGLRLRLDGAAEPVADMPEARVRLSLAAACLGRLEVTASGRTLGGELTVAAASDSLFGGGWREAVIAVRGLDLGLSPGMPWLVNRHVGGRVSGEARVHPGKTVTGKVGLLFEDAFVEVEGEMLRAVRVELGRMAVRAEIKDGGLDVTEGTVASDMLRGGLTGRIVPEADIRASRLDMTGTFSDEIQAELAAPRPAAVRLTGTLTAPVLTWGEEKDADPGGPPPGPEAPAGDAAGP